jgi:hypothetical protein
MSTLQETLAVDLYVLERAFASTHPASEALFSKVGLLRISLWIISSRYNSGIGGLRRRIGREKMEARWSETRCWYVTGLEGSMLLLMPFVDSVRLRGRKRDMIG